MSDKKLLILSGISVILAGLAIASFAASLFVWVAFSDRLSSLTGMIATGTLALAAVATAGAEKYIRGPSILHGDGIPSDSIGTNGDLYLDTSTADLYEKTDGTWGVNAK